MLTAVMPQNNVLMNNDPNQQSLEVLRDTLENARNNEVIQDDGLLLA